MDSTMEKRLAARLGRSWHRAFVTDWSKSSSEGVGQCGGLDLDRFFFDHDSALPRRPFSVKSQRYRRPQDRNVGLHIKQDGREGGLR